MTSDGQVDKRRSDSRQRVRKARILQKRPSDTATHGRSGELWRRSQRDTGGGSYGSMEILKLTLDKADA
jgi:hypothetical protein